MAFEYPYGDLSMLANVSSRPRSTPAIAFDYGVFLSDGTVDEVSASAMDIDTNGNLVFSVEIEKPIRGGGTIVGPPERVKWYASGAWVKVYRSSTARPAVKAEGGDA